MKFIETIAILAALLISGEALQCYNCTSTKANGQVVPDSTIACEGSEVTCEDPMNACMISTIGYQIDVQGQKMSGETSSTNCAVKIGEDAACKLLEDMLTGEGSPIEDFTCSVKYCDTDLCTTGSGRAAHFSFFLGASLVALYGVFL